MYPLSLPKSPEQIKKSLTVLLYLCLYIAFCIYIHNLKILNTQHAVPFSYAVVAVILELWGLIVVVSKIRTWDSYLPIFTGLITAFTILPPEATYTNKAVSLITDFLSFLTPFGGYLAIFAATINLIALYRFTDKFLSRSNIMSIFVTTITYLIGFTSI